MSGNQQFIFYPIDNYAPKALYLLCERASFSARKGLFGESKAMVSAP